MKKRSLLKNANLPGSQVRIVTEVFNAGLSAGEILGGILSDLIDKGVEKLFSKNKHNG